MTNGVTIDLGKYPGASGVNGNGKTYTYDGGNVSIEENRNPAGLSGYKSVIHKPKDKETKITSIQDSKSQTKFKNPITECESVVVFYWESDDTHSNPLLLELTSSNKSSSYYTLVNAGSDNTWSEDQGAAGTLRQKLNNQNCLKNRAHIVDISRNSSYYCPSCNFQWVSVSNYDKTETSGDYSYSHHLSSGSFLRFMDGMTEQTGINFLQSTTRVYVYYYPSGYNRIPLLIYLPLPSNKWFERTSVDSNTWKSVGGSKPTSTFDKEKILKILKAILPTVTIDLGRTSGSSPTYSDSSEQINLKRQDLTGSFSSLSHSVQGKSAFIVKNVQHNGSTLLGIDKSLILKNVTAYYEGDNLDSMDCLLMVELEKRGSGSNNYAYYGRDNTGYRWTLLDGKTEKLKSTSLTNKLKELKEKLANSSQEPDTAGGQTAQLGGASEAQGKAAGLSSGVIAGIAIGVMGAVASIVILVWRRKVMVKAMTTL
ncbi:hypothetical protein BEWA_045570 [Theileria equi strain WA]|uniref:Uncharacterized protein n=1 Tax=Theileria equi strain WA TaxID=1537102 RepID=L1LA94_THEEQ|nr:hypothetical protein BEWA_045570 [Theileria equi strain WA]EKX72093.1 hypothetical protein BEWA_045570 [Theileria equi strain WA]|eukprot:XP_004831545.1 hypothetical protein BEWA_045570 [Theileria equi strain WA]